MWWHGCSLAAADPNPQIRDHSNIARAYAALGTGGFEEVKALLLQVAQDCGFADASILSSDTTQELPIGYPNEPGSLRGGAALWPRPGEAQNPGGGGSRCGPGTGADDPQDSQRTPLFALGKQAKRQVLTRLLTEVGQWIVQTRLLVQGLGSRRDRVTQHALTTLQTMHEVAKRLIPQIVQWITTGVVAKGKILQAGVTQARAPVRHKAGKEVEFGLPYLLSRLGGGYVFGTLIRGVVDESKRPLQALAGYREMFCTRHSHTDGLRPGWLRHGDPEGSGSRGCQTDRHPAQGQPAWSVAEAVRETVRSERGKTEGIIGTLKTDKYGFNKPTERLWHTLEMAGPRSILSYNLNKFMDLVRANR